MGMDTPVSKVYWLGLVMGFTLAVMAIEGWGNVISLPVWSTPVVVAPGSLAFAMVLSGY